MTVETTPVQGALELLRVLDDLPVADHVEVFEAVYGALADSLDAAAR